MSINHLRGHTSTLAISMDSRKSEGSTIAEKKIKSVNISHDLPSTSCNVMTYMHFLPPSLLSKMKAEPDFIDSCLENLDVAIKNNAERKETRAKCAIIKMLLEGNSLENIFDCFSSVCSTYKASLKLRKKEALALMLEYYLVGGLKLLRGFPCSSHSPLYPASVMNFVLMSLEKNAAYTSGFIIKEELKQRIARGECFEGINASTIPTAFNINNFIAACEYKKNQANRWFLPSELTESTVSISQKINFAVLSKLQQTETIKDDLLESPCRVKMAYSTLTKSAMLINLETAIDNDVETDKNKVKFIAVKMLLLGFTYKEVMRQCGYLYIDNFERNVSWNPEKLDLLLHNYFLGGLRFLRAFSLQSRLTFSQLKTMSFLVASVEFDPYKGSAAILSAFKRLKAADQLPLSIDRSSSLPSNDVLYNFLIRCGYTRAAHKWIWNEGLTQNILLDAVQQIQLSDQSSSNEGSTEVNTPNVEQEDSLKQHEKLKSSVNFLGTSVGAAQSLSPSFLALGEGMAIEEKEVGLSLLETLLQSSYPNSPENLTTSAHSLDSAQSLCTEVSKTDESTMPYELVRSSMELLESPIEMPQGISFGLASSEQDSVQVGDICTSSFDEKIIAQERALEASMLESEKGSLAELTRLMLSFESLSSCSSQCSLEEISDHIENSSKNLSGYPFIGVQNINTKAEQRLEINSDELKSLPNIDSKELFEFLSQCESKESAEFQLNNDQFVNVNANTEKKAMIPSSSHSLLSASSLYPYDWNNESAEFKLQQPSLGKLQIQNDAAIAMLNNHSSMNEFEAQKAITAYKERKSTNEEPSTSLNRMKNLSIKAQIANLNAAIANDSESELNRIKFTAVKMFLEEKYSNEVIAKTCNSLFLRSPKNRNSSWTQEKFMLLKHYYLEGGLALLRGFSFKSLPMPVSAEIMSLVIRLIEENPQKSTMAILKMISQMNANIDPSALPIHTVIEKFLARCGYQRIDKKWVFDSTLTTNIPSHHLQEEQVSTNPSLKAMSEKTAKRHSSEKLPSLAQKKIRKMSIESQSDFLNQEESSLLKTISDNLAEAIANDLESAADKNKFTAVKMLLEGSSYQEISNHCNYPLFVQTKKNIFWTPKKLELLLDSYLQGGLCLVRGFSFRSHHDITLQKKMGFIIRLVSENLEKGSSAILRQIKYMNEVGAVPEGINFSSLPSHGALDAFIARCGYERIPKKQWIFKPYLTPNLPFYGLQKAQVMKQTALRDQFKTVSEQSGNPTLKFH